MVWWFEWEQLPGPELIGPLGSIRGRGLLKEVSLEWPGGPKKPLTTEPQPVPSLPFLATWGVSSQLFQSPLLHSTITRFNPLKPSAQLKPFFDKLLGSRCFIRAVKNKHMQTSKGKDYLFAYKKSRRGWGCSSVVECLPSRPKSWIASHPLQLTEVGSDVCLYPKHQGGGGRKTRSSKSSLVRKQVKSRRELH